MSRYGSPGGESCALCEPERNSGRDSAEANRSQDSIFGVSAIGHSLRDVRRMIPGELDDKRLTWVQDSFLSWARRPDYLAFYDGEKDQWLMRSAAKRGNLVYRWRVEERLKESCGFIDAAFMDAYGVRYQNGKPVGNVLFITLTSKPDVSRRGMWIDIMRKYNRFITAFRKIYGHCFVVRCIESTEKGMPHIHLLLLCEDSFEVFSKTCTRGKNCGKQFWRVEAGREIQDLWRVEGRRSPPLGVLIKCHSPDLANPDFWTKSAGYVDVQAVAGGRCGAEKVRGYLFKDLLKQTCADLGPGVVSQANITLALNWFFGKRSFAVSGKAAAADLIMSVHNSNQNLNKIPVLELVERKNLTFCGVVRLDIRGDPDFFMVLPGSLVREDERFRILRDLLPVRERMLREKEELPEWWDWKDTREEQLSWPILKVIKECQDIVRGVV